MISNRLLFKEVFKKNIWAMVLSLILFFVFMFLPTFMLISNYIGIWYGAEKTAYISEIFAYSAHGASWHIVPLVFMAIIMGIKSFVYLHNKKKVDFYHSLPVKRSKIFFLNYVMGILSVIPAYIISALLLTALIYSLGFGEYISILLVFKNIIWNIVFFIVIYSIFNLATILTGNTIISVFLGSFLLSFTGLIVFLKAIMSDLAVYNIDYYTDIQIIKEFTTIPIISMFFMSMDNLKDDLFSSSYSLYGNFFNYTSIILKYVIFIIVILAINYWLFIKRKSEKAGDCIAFDKIKAPLKYVGVILGAMYVSVMFQVIGDTVWSFIGILIACILFHFIVEIVYEFDFKAIFKNWYSIFGCILIAVGISGALRIDIPTKINIVVPDAEKVAQVDIFNYSYLVNSGEPLEEPKSIENVLKLLEYLKEYRENGIDGEYRDYYYLRLGYKLKNGKIEYIEESIPMTDEIKQVLYDILDSEEYILKRDSVLNMTVTENSEVYLYETLFGKNAVYNEYGEGQEFLLTLQNDIKNSIGKDKGEIIYSLSLNVYNPGEWVSRYPIYESYTETIKLIEERINVKQLSAEDILRIELEFIQDSSYIPYSGEGIKLEAIEDISYSTYSATTLEEIEYILENIKPRENLEYDDTTIWIYFKEGNGVTEYILTKDVKEVIEDLKNISANIEDSKSGIIDNKDDVIEIRLP